MSRSTSAKTVAVIRHVHFEDLGSFEPVFREAGFTVRYFDAGVDDFSDSHLSACELLAVLGAPIGAYEEDKYPFLLDEFKVLESRLAAGKTILGICLGAQLLARVLGSKVYPGPAKEIGWSPLTLTEAGLRGPIRHLESLPVLHWHGDTFDLPQRAERLASTPICQNQAFAMGPNVLAFQFHPEAVAAGFERWLIGHAAEVSGVHGLSVNALRADTQRYASALQPAAQSCLKDWLSQTDLAF